MSKAPIRCIISEYDRFCDRGSISQSYHLYLTFVLAVDNIYLMGCIKNFILRIINKYAPTFRVTIYYLRITLDGENSGDA